jgi:hypothetical protein
MRRLAGSGSDDVSKSQPTAAALSGAPPRIKLPVAAAPPKIARRVAKAGSTASILLSSLLVGVTANDLPEDLGVGKTPMEDILGESKDDDITEIMEKSSICVRLNTMVTWPETASESYQR